MLNAIDALDIRSNQTLPDHAAIACYLDNRITNSSSEQQLEALRDELLESPAETGTESEAFRLRALTMLDGALDILRAGAMPPNIQCSDGLFLTLTSSANFGSSA